MSLYNEIIEFLGEKIERYNEALKKEKMLLEQTCNPDENSIAYNLHNHCILQYKINLCLNMLQGVVFINKGIEEKQEFLSQKTHDFLSFLVDDIVQERSVFDAHHALFGFEPFHELLLQSYVKQERFEKCIELIKLFNSREKP